MQKQGYLYFFFALNLALGVLGILHPVTEARAGELYPSRSFSEDFNYGEYDLRNRRLPFINHRRSSNLSTAAERGAFNMFRPLPGTGVNIFEERRFAYARWKYNYEVRAYEWYVRELQKSKREQAQQQYRVSLESQRRERIAAAQSRRGNLEKREPGSPRGRPSESFFSRWTGGSSNSAKSSTSAAEAKTEKSKEQKPSFWSKLKYSLFGSKTN